MALSLNLSNSMIYKTKAPAADLLVDLIVKHFYDNASKISVRLKENVVVRHLPSAKRDDMKHYVKPTLGKQPEQNNHSCWY